jgi:hypothetical protein
MVVGEFDFLNFLKLVKYRWSCWEGWRTVLGKQFCGGILVGRGEWGR